MDYSIGTYCIFTCGVIYTIFTIIPKLGRWWHLFKLASKFPGPPALPFIGNAHLFIGSTEAILDRLLQLGKLYPTTYRLWIGSYLLFVVNTPEQFKIVLLSPKTINKGELYKFIRPWLGAGLITASATKWRIHRKLIQPTFGTSIIQSFVKVFANRSVMMADKMEQYLDGPEFEIHNYTAERALHTICETTMGVKLGEQANDDGYYAAAIEEIYIPRIFSETTRSRCACVGFAIGRGSCSLTEYSRVIASSSRRVVSPWLHPNFIFHRTQLGKNQQKYIKFLHTFTDNVIQTKKNELLEQDHRIGLDDGEEKTSNRISRKQILLDYLIEESHESYKFSDESIREEVDTIMAAGTDTTAGTSSYVMLMLASYPEIQEKVYQELCEIYEDHDDDKSHVTWEDLTRMTYLERVIKETMRLFPSSPTITRLVTDDLDIGEQTFPAGSSVVLSIIELHRNADIWPEPMKFDPDRFLPEEVRKRDSYTYLPFSGGPRDCIGSKYAMMSLKTLLATILRRYILKKDNIIPVKDLRWKWEFQLRPVDPITLRIEKRIQKVASI